MIVLKHTKEFYLKFFLTFVLVFFLITYITVNRDTINKQVEVITEGGSFFAKTATYELLKFNTTNPGFNTETYDIELKIFKNINQIRVENKLNELKWDPMLAELAREHSLDMVDNHYFNHTDLLGMGPNERARLLGIKTTIETDTKIYKGLSENIGLMPRGIVKDVGVLITEDDISWGMVYRWMVSPPHRKNILDPELFYTGIGVAYDGKGNYYLTQNFQ